MVGGIIIGIVVGIILILATVQVINMNTKWKRIIPEAIIVDLELNTKDAIKAVNQFVAVQLEIRYKRNFLNISWFKTEKIIVRNSASVESIIAQFTTMRIKDVELSYDELTGYTVLERFRCA